MIQSSVVVSTGAFTAAAEGCAATKKHARKSSSPLVASTRAPLVRLLPELYPHPPAPVASVSSAHSLTACRIHRSTVGFCCSDFWWRVEAKSRAVWSENTMPTAAAEAPSGAAPSSPDRAMLSYLPKRQSLDITFKDVKYSALALSLNKRPGRNIL